MSIEESSHFSQRCAGFHVNEVIVETVFVLKIVRQKTQRVAYTLQNLRGRAKTAMVADAQARQAKSRGCDAGHGTRVVSIRQSAVLHLARFRACFKPEKIEGRALNFVQQFFVGPLIRRSRGLDECFL